MYCTFVSSLNATASVNVRWTCSGPQTWLRCSIELVSRPVFSSSGKVLFSKVLWCLMFGGLWIWTCAATSIFPFRPNLGDHMFSSISVSSATVATLVEVRSLLEPLPLLELEPYRQNRRPTCQLTAQTDTSAQLWLFDMKTNSRFQTNGFWVLADEVFFSPLFQGRQIMIKFLLHFLLTHTQTVPEDQTNIFYSLFWIFFFGKFKLFTVEYILHIYNLHVSHVLRTAQRLICQLGQSLHRKSFCHSCPLKHVVNHRAVQHLFWATVKSLHHREQNKKERKLSRSWYNDVNWWSFLFT